MTETFRPAFVHRLDKETSGVILAGKTPAAVRYYTAEFAERNTQKKYFALIKGILPEKEGSIEKSLLKEGKKTSLSEGGKKALTTYEVCEEYGIKATLVKVQIYTGRMHQIRAHFASIGHPVIGDRQYGDKRINALFREKYDLKRLFLHAYELTFKDMKGRVIKKRAPLAVELQEVLKSM